MNHAQSICLNTFRVADKVQHVEENFQTLASSSRHFEVYADMLLLSLVAHS